MRLAGCNALITGASAGIGREFARAMAGQAQSLVLVARRRANLEELRDELLQVNPNLKIHIVETDLAQAAQVTNLLQHLANDNLEISLLINNAGLGDLGSFATSDPERIEQMLRVNMIALTSLTRALLPRMLERGHGGILNVSSSASFLPIPQFSVYAATKAYVTSFSEGLRAELRGTGISVCALCPGPVHTEFTQVAQRAASSTELGPAFVYVSAAKVARAGLRAIEKDRPLVIPGLFMKVAMLFVRMMPMAILRLTSKFSAKRITAD